MKSKLLAVVLLAFTVILQTHAQQRRPGGGGLGGQPRFDSAMAKLFGKNTAFSSQIVMEMKSESAGMTMPGKLAFLDGKSRFKMDMANAKGASLPPQAVEQMKAMGMAEIISITRPDKKEQYLVYPGLKSYAAIPSTDTQSADGSQKPDDLKKTELGKETINGHPCTKYKVLIKDDTGKEHESMIWSASDLKDFPIKIEMTNEGVPSTITFNDVKFEKPDESLFNPPADFQRYNDPNTMMREAMMKRFAPPGANAAGTPPGVIPPGGTQPPPPQSKAPQK